MIAPAGRQRETGNSVNLSNDKIKQREKKKFKQIVLTAAAEDGPARW